MGQIEAGSTPVTVSGSETDLILHGRNSLYLKVVFSNAVAERRSSLLTEV
jgi:hypothetical protein